jgi:hypothetical protein
VRWAHFRKVELLVVGRRYRRDSRVWRLGGRDGHVAALRLQIVCVFGQVWRWVGPLRGQRDAAFVRMLIVSAHETQTCPNRRAPRTRLRQDVQVRRTSTQNPKVSFCFAVVSSNVFALIQHTVAVTPTGDGGFPGYDPLRSQAARSERIRHILQ